MRDARSPQHPDDLQITHNEAHERYEAAVGGDLAIIQYRRDGNTLSVLHTEVPEAFEGRGIGTALAKRLLEDARTRRLEVIPYCPFVRSFINENPEWIPCVADSHRHLIRERD